MLRAEGFKRLEGLRVLAVRLKTPDRGLFRRGGLQPGIVPFMPA
jgi:hypothetical protein